MHRDIARLVVLLAVVRVLTVVACPAPAPTPSWLTHREQDWQLKHRVTRRRPATPRPSRDTESGCSRSHDLRDVTPSHAALCRCGLPSGPTTQGPPEPQGTERAPAGGSPLRSPEPHRTPLPSSPAAEAAGVSPAAAAAAAPIGDLDSGGPGGGSQIKRSRPAARSGGRRPQRRGARGRRGKTNGGRRPSVGTGLLNGALNVQSLWPKILELAEELHRNHYDAMLLSETWLKPGVPNRLLVIPGYSILRVDRPDGRGYGGVAIVVKEYLSATKLRINTQRSPDSRLETIWSLLKLDRGRQLLLCSLYRPPRYTATALSNDFTDLETQLQRVTLDHPNVSIVICGDLNCDLLKTPPAPARARLEEFLTDYSLLQSVTTPTFTSGSLLDVCIANRSNLVTSCLTKLCNYSPHNIIRINIDVPRNRRKSTIVRSRSLSSIQPDAFLFDLQRCDWQPVFDSPSVDAKWSAFLSLFLPILDEHAPMKTRKIRNPSAPPVTSATKAMMSRRRGALRSCGRDSSEYRDLNRAVRSAIRRDTRIDIETRIREQGPHTVWRNIRSVVAGKRVGREVAPQLTPQNLNEFFVSVGPRVAAEIASETDGAVGLACRLPRVGACGFTVHPIDIVTLGDILFSMRSSPACGSDGVCVRAFKASFPAVGYVILHIINTCLTQTDYPPSWKHSIIHPIFKAGDPADPSNFRPISIIPVISKVVERVVQRQLYRYLSFNHLLSPNQHGFRPLHSTETALTTVTDQILTATDDGELTLMCLIDLSKCFDIIDHKILLRKLMLHGIDTQWFREYLGGHTQSVSLRDPSGNAQVSPPLPNSIGVFQGSALGPLLFTVFANDLSLFAGGACVVQYADDTQVIVSGKKNELPSLIKKMENSLARLDEWFCENALKVNAKKTQLIAIGSRQNLRELPSFEISFRDTLLIPCSEVKNLGVTFDKNLSWDSHVGVVSQRCNGILIGMSHVRHVLPHSIVKTLVTALVLSHVRYCLPVYGNGTKKNMDRIQKILNFAARVIFGRRKFDHVSDLRERLGWLPAQLMADHSTVCLAHKVSTSGEPDSLASTLRHNCDTRQRNTRQDSLMYVPRSRSEAGKRRFCARAPALHNKLSSDLAPLSRQSFSRTLKERMLSLNTT